MKSISTFVLASLLVATPALASNWLNYAVTLKPIAGSPTPTPTSTPTPTPTATPTPTPTPTPGTAIKANDFLNSLGADTHIVQGQSASAIQAAIGYSGIRNIRDDFTTNTATQAEFCSIHAATGVMVDELVGSGDLTDSIPMWESLANCGAMLAAEGPNEPNNFGFSYNGGNCGGSSSTWLACAQFQRDLYTAVHSDSKLAGKPVWDMTEVGAEADNQGLQNLSLPPGSSYPLPAGTQFADVANVHNYLVTNSGFAPIDNHVFYAESIARSGPDAGAWDLCNEYWGATWGHGFAVAAPPYGGGPCEGTGAGQNNIPKVTTETNYFPTSSVNTTLQGKMIADLYLQAYRMGFSNTFVYLLMDAAGNGGLFTINGNEGDAGNANPPGVYVHNLTTILADTSSAFTVGPGNPTVSNMPSTGYSMLMQKSNGTYELAIWGESFASETTTGVLVSLGANYSTVNVYDVTSGTAPTSSLTNVTSLTVPISDHPIIVEFH